MSEVVDEAGLSPVVRNGRVGSSPSMSTKCYRYVAPSGFISALVMALADSDSQIKQTNCQGVATFNQTAKWPVGETVNAHGFHPCIRGFNSRTGHQIPRWRNGNAVRFERIMWWFESISWNQMLV